MPSCLMRFCRLLCSAFSAPFYLLGFIGSRGMYKRVFPFLAYNITFSYNDKIHNLKRELFRNLARFASADGTSRLSEIGCGSGANFGFYPYGCTVICTDPNPHMEPYSRRSMEANKHSNYEAVLVLSGEDMRDVRDESVDVVVCTSVSCSVSKVERVSHEARRILRHGGALYFSEHVVSDPTTWTYFCQYVFEPLWFLIGDGCRVTRATWKNSEAAGFVELHLRHIEAPGVSLMIRPHIMGYSIK